MPNIKLGRIPDRTPVKLAISVLPDLHQSLVEYGKYYLEAYGREEQVVDLIPAILTTFLESDRDFTRGRMGKSS